MLSRMKLIKALVPVLALAFSAMSAQAATIVQTGAGAVTTVDRLATFDTLTSYNAANLSTYSESMLDIQSQISAVNFPICSGCWYANGGIADGSLAVISGSDGARFSAVEFQISSGGGSSGRHFRWETYRGGSLVGSGGLLVSGGIVGFMDALGFDELHVGVFFESGNIRNLIGMDNVKAQLAPIVPVPASLPLLLTGLGIAGWAGRRRKA